MGKIKQLGRKKILISTAILVILVISIFLIYLKLNSGEIRSVKKILSTEYYDISCVDSNCNSIAAYTGDKLGESKIYLLNSDGKIVGKYSENYDSKSKTTNKIYQIMDNYYIVKNIDNESKDVKKYIIYNSKGKKIYDTENILNALSNNLIIMGSENYTLLDSKGKELYTNIKEYTSYYDSNIIEINLNDNTIILDKEGNVLLSNFSISKDVRDEKENLIYLIIKDIKNNVYQYFDVDSLKIKGDSFENYIIDNNEVIITRSVNGKQEKYSLNNDGKQEKIEENSSSSEIVSKIKSNLDLNKYYLYSISVYSDNQQYVLVDNKESKEFGILDIKNNKFTKIYSYNANSTNFYSTVNKLKNDKSDDIYLQISCLSTICEQQKLYVYDLSNAKELYNTSDSGLVAQNYIQYSDNYKVIKYSYSSSSSDYKGKYVLYDSDNKELLKSNYEIVVIDKEKLFGPDTTNNLMLYSASKNKTLNIENASATVININDKVFYRYNDENMNTIIIDSNANEIIKANSSQYLQYSDEAIIYVEDNIVKFYDVEDKKTKEYKMLENERLTDSFSNIIPPYKRALFINNEDDNYIKIINSNGKIKKKIKKVQIYSVTQNDKGNIFMIVKKKQKSGNLYGLYMAK